MRIGVLVACLMTVFRMALSQCPVADFSIPASACLGESIYANNTSSAATSWQWDFCSGDLALPPSAAVIASNQSLFRARTFRMINASGDWFGFAIDQNAYLVRLDFGNSPQNVPALVNLGNPQGEIQLAYDLAFWQEGSLWYALVANTSANNLLLLSFGANMASIPTVTNLGSLSGTLKAPAGIQLIKEGADLYALVTNSSAPEVVRLFFGNSITNMPATSVYPLAGAVSLRGVSFTRECGHGFALVSDNGGSQLFYLDFPSGIQNTPMSGVLSIPSSSYSFPVAISIQHEGGSYYAIIQSGFPSNVYRIDFGTSIIDLAGVYQDMGSFNQNTAPPNAQFNGAFEMINIGSDWTAFSVDLSDPGGNGKLLKLSFPNNCSSAVQVSAARSPMTKYSSTGTYRISLTALDNSGKGDSYSKLVTVSALNAPDIEFSSQNNCALNDVLFSSVNASGNIVSYDWDFGDSQGSSSANTPHAYATSGVYDPKLTVIASNGCTNVVIHPLTVYDVPQADFALPAVTPVCTNQQYLFTNTSSYDVPSNPTWEWRVNGVLQSIQPDLSASFIAAAPQEIRLKAKIPGCENEMTKNIGSVLVGPTVDFLVGDDCALNAVAFTNTSSGVDAGFTWNFGDGTPSSPLVDPAHPYDNPGTYAVSLTGSNVGGCQNQTTKNITIYSNPQPDFSVGLPPFSCSNTPTPFQNTTPPLTDSNITSWSWSFGDPLASASAQRDPSFTYAVGGNYSVTLTATSDQGCSKSINKLIAIGTSPVADFVLGPACVNQPTQFTDISSGGVQSRAWQIGSGAFSTANPTYTFLASGSYTATLTVTAAGGCTSFRSKPIMVPQQPVLAMTADNPCAGQPTTFTLFDATAPPVPDAAIGWQWNIAGTQISGNPATHTISLTGISPYTVTTTHLSGCMYTSSGNVTIHPTPVASFNAAPDRGDPPLTVQFENLSTGASQYLWSFSGKTPGISTVVSPAYTFVELGEYTATLAATNSFGCTDIHSMPIQVLLSSVDLELTSFTLSPDPLTGKSRATVTIKNSSNIPITSTEIALHLSEKAVVNESLSINLLPGASVTSTLSFTFDPSQFEARFVCAEILSEKDVQQDNNRRCISLDAEDYVFPPYPNPSSGPMQVDWVSEKAGTARITVFNSQGRQEYQWDTPSAAGLNQSIHDLAFLAAGIYLVTIQTSTTIQTMRFIRF